MLIKTGANASMGTALLAAGSAIVSNTIVTTASMIFMSNISVGGTAGALWISNVTANASFYIRSTIATDSSKIAYLIIEPA